MLTPPTDTLPKFCAIAGLAAVISTFGWHLHVRRELEELVVEQAIPNLEFTRLATSIAKIDASVEEGLRKLESSLVPDQDLLRRTREQHNESVKLRIAADKIVVESESRIVAARLAARRSWESLLGVALALVGGSIASYWGFSNWAAAEKRKRRATAA